MYIFQILSYFFKKVGDQEAIKEFIDQLFKIPKALRNLLGIVILLGVIYFSYSKIYTNEIQELRTEVKNVKVVVEDAVDKDKMKGKVIVTKFGEKRFGSSFNWKTLGLMFDCYDEYKELLEKDWNEYCDEIMLNKYVEDEDEVYFGNVLAGTDKKTGNIDMWQCRIKLVEKISKFDYIYECKIIALHCDDSDGEEY